MQCTKTYRYRSGAQGNVHINSEQVDKQYNKQSTTKKNGVKKKSDLSDFGCGIIVGARLVWVFVKLLISWDFQSLEFYSEQHKEKKTSSEQQLCRQKHLVADHVHPFMATIYPSSNGCFQYDNAPCHKAKVASSFMNMKVTVTVENKGKPFPVFIYCVPKKVLSECMYTSVWSNCY